MSRDNRFNSSHVQALIDLCNLGFGSKPIEQVLEDLEHNPKLVASLMEVWNKRVYSDDSIKWAQFSRVDGLMTLSAPALKIFCLLGVYANQSGFIKIDYNTILKITSIKSRASISEALTELKNGGCIRVEMKGAHGTLIYQINQSLINVGRKSSSFDLSDVDDDEYIFTKALKSIDKENLFDYGVVINKRIDTLGDGSKIIYNELSVDLTKKEFSDLTKESENTNH